MPPSTSAASSSLVVATKASRSSVDVEIDLVVLLRVGGALDLLAADGHRLPVERRLALGIGRVLEAPAAGGPSRRPRRGRRRPPRRRSASGAAPKPIATDTSSGETPRLRRNSSASALAPPEFANSLPRIESFCSATPPIVSGISASRSSAPDGSDGSAPSLEERPMARRWRDEGVGLADAPPPLQAAAARARSRIAARAARREFTGAGQPLAEPAWRARPDLQDSEGARR